MTAYEREECRKSLRFGARVGFSLVKRKEVILSKEIVRRHSRQRIQIESYWEQSEN
jgi:hypothetical protein